MKITELLSKNSILLGAAQKSKEEAIDTLVDLMEKGDKLNEIGRASCRERVY